MSKNKKITDLPLRSPIRGFNFVVATGDYNYRIEYAELEAAIKASISDGGGGGGGGGGTDLTDLLNKINLLSGQVEDLDGDLNNTGIYLIDLIDSLSGDLVATGDHLHEHIDINSGNLINTGQLLDTLIDTLSGKTIAQDAYLNEEISYLSGGLYENLEILSGNLIATGEYLSEHIEEGHGLPGGSPGTSESSFIFFTDFYNNTGPTFKTYYETPTQNTVLSGVTVDSLQNVKATIRWDGPDSHYMGTGYINNQQIPFSNVIELGDKTRRFEGYLDNLNLNGQSTLTGSANGASGIIPLTELGSGPSASNITIDQISNSIPKAGEQKGTTALKAGDKINVFITYDFSIYLDEKQHPNTIEVKDDGLADHIGFTSYSLNDNGDNTHTATIPVTVSDRVGDLGVQIRAINNLGSTGAFQSSVSDFAGADDSRLLDQLYPTITASDPTSYNGRSDGLREGESTTFINSVANWDSANDTILYTTSTVNNANISIASPNSFSDPKNISYVDGIFADTANVNISTLRTVNGATDSEDIIVKIANGPEITSLTIPNQAKTAVAPNVVGATEIKGGDVIEVVAEIDTQGEAANSIQIRVFNEGISNGAAFSTYNSTPAGGDVHQYIIPVTVTSSAARNGPQSVKIEAKNQYGTLSDDKTSSNQITVNQTAPAASISSVSYPSSQEAIKSGESATISNSVSGEDSVLYESPSVGGSTQLDVSNPTTNESSKNVDYQAGGYNITTDNFKITATKNSNGAVTVAETTVNIANDALQLSITSLASSLESSPAGIDDSFNLNSNQKFLSVPTLSLDSSQSPASQLQVTNSGTNEQSNKFKITVKDVDKKGTFTWGVVAHNLANIKTETITTNPNYILSGFSERKIFVHWSDNYAGLGSIGTSVSDPNNITLENVSKSGGTGPNNGTYFTYQPYPAGTQLTPTYDVIDKFTICNSNLEADPNGDYFFNLDSLNRATNTASPGAVFWIKED